jgi:excisionase family DNA binding protein
MSSTGTKCVECLDVEIVGVSRTAVYNAIAEGRLKSHEMVLPRRVLRINAQEVKEFKVSKSHQHRGKRPSGRSRK